MRKLPLREAGPKLAAMFEAASDAELERLVTLLLSVEDELRMVVLEAGHRAPSARVSGITLHDVPPRCLTANLRLGDLLLHFAILPPRYFTSAKDDLWRVAADANLVCAHPEHDIDPVAALPTRTASSPAGAVEEALLMARLLRAVVPTWALGADDWHGRT